MAVALQREDGFWLMHRRPAHKHHGGLWEFPGGKVEARESPVNALIRELDEELGIACEASAIEPMAFAQEERGDDAPAIVILLYKVAEWRGEPRALDEGAAIGWFTPGQIAGLERPPLDRALCAQIFAGAPGHNVAG